MNAHAEIMQVDNKKAFAVKKVSVGDGVDLEHDMTVAAMRLTGSWMDDTKTEDVLVMLMGIDKAAELSGLLLWHLSRDPRFREGVEKTLDRLKMLESEEDDDG